MSIINKLLDIFKNFAVLCQGSKQLLAKVKPMSSDVYLKNRKDSSRLPVKNNWKSLIFIDS